MSSPAQRRAATSLAMTAPNSGLHVPLPPDVMARSLGEVYAHFRTAGFGADLKRRILLGTADLTAEYATHTLLPQDMTSDHMGSLAAHSTTVAINTGLNVQQTSASAKECEPKADCADTKLSWHGNAHTRLVFTCADTKLCTVSTGNERERNLSNAHLSWHGNAHTEGAIAELRKY